MGHQGVEEGKHVIYVVVDPDTLIEEINEDNNEAGQEITIISVRKVKEVGVKLPWWVIILFIIVALIVSFAVYMLYRKREPLYKPEIEEEPEEDWLELEDVENKSNRCIKQKVVVRKVKSVKNRRAR